MALLLRKLINFHDYAIENWADPRGEDVFLMKSIWPIAALSCVYIYIALDLGPKLMEKREPFKLNKVLLVYNLIQAISSLFIAVAGAVYVIPYTNYFCAPVDTSFPYASLNWKLGYMNFILKIADLLDTLFFILKKSNRQISFLHVYHHWVMVLSTWIGVKFLPGGSNCYLVWINSIVHATMYSYYLLSTVYEPSKIVWLKRHITHLQLLQFGILIMIYGWVTVGPYCGYPKLVSSLVFIQNLFMCILFGDFYYNTYLKPRKGAKDLRKAE